MYCERFFVNWISKHIKKTIDTVFNYSWVELCSRKLFQACAKCTYIYLLGIYGQLKPSRKQKDNVGIFVFQVPPNVPGLIRAIESKYKINAANIRCLYRKTKGGILAKIDDEMLKYYSNEDSFLMQVRPIK